MAVILIAPLVVLAISLAQRSWYPTGDQAQAELRMLSLPGDPPLVGAAGRIEADDGQQGNHPGPLMFWATWPAYEVLGGSSWAFETATLAVNAAWLALAILLVRDRAGASVTIGFGAVALVMLGGLGLDALSQPWNPWVALLPFAVLMLAVWAVLDGLRWPLVAAVAAGSYALQGHVGYAPLVPPLLALATGALVWRERPRGPDDRRAALGRMVAVPLAVVVGLLLWSGPIFDAITRDPGNLTILMQHFGSPEEEAIGLGAGLTGVLRGLNPFGPLLWGKPALVGSVLPGAALVMGWALVSGLVARRGLSATLTRLNAVTALTLAIGVLAVSRVFGDLYLYTFRWIVVLSAMMLLALGWGVGLLAAPRLARVGRPRFSPVVVAVVALALLSVATSVRLSGQEIPYWQTSQMTAGLAAEVETAVDHDLTYLVRWEDPVYLGGVAYGVFLDLARDGVEVGVDPRHSAAAEPHRVRCPSEADALLTVVTGTGRITEWDERPDQRRVAEVDLRGPGEQQRAAADREALAALLSTPEAPVSAEEVEDRLSLVVLDTAQPPEVIEIATRLVSEGVPTAVYLGPLPDGDSPNGC